MRFGWCLFGWVSGYCVLFWGVEYLEIESRSWFCFLFIGKEGWDINLMLEELFLVWGFCIVG